MSTTISWNEIALRLFLTIAAGLIIGFNRGEHGRPAGMRTTLLVCLAASLSMLQANLLMNTAGRSQDSFVTLDLMRLPLGVLSGMGFIGAGTILRKGNLVLGVTTAATLWFVTMMGLCFGGGQLGLGLIALVLGTGTLWGLKHLENLMHREMRGTLMIQIRAEGLTDADIRTQISNSDCTPISWGICYLRDTNERVISCELEWRAKAGHTTPPAIVEELRTHPAVAVLRWQPQGVAGEDPNQATGPHGTTLANMRGE